MKILITGADGYLGRGICKCLSVKSNDAIIATDIKDISNNKEIFGDQKKEQVRKYKKCDLFSLSDPYLYFEKPDMLIHLAWRDGFSHYSESHILDLPKHWNFIKNMMDSEGG